LVLFDVDVVFVVEIRGGVKKEFCDEDMSKLNPGIFVLTKQYLLNNCWRYYRNCTEKEN